MGRFQLRRLFPIPSLDNERSPEQAAKGRKRKQTSDLVSGVGGLSWRPGRREGEMRGNQGKHKGRGRLDWTIGSREHRQTLESATRVAGVAV
jgi:hypothetical protein